MTRFPQAATHSDASELGVRIDAQLARRGDARAAESITRQATEPCADEQQETRAAALSALLNMNADQAIPILQKVLQQRDACSAELRRQAVFLISQKMNDESVEILLDVAHRHPDPDPEVREQAVFWLSQVKAPEAVDALESILKESKDPDLQEKAIFAISQHGSERAFQILRAYAERADAPEELRANAIFWIGQNPRAGGTDYLVDLYPKLTDPDLKERAVFAIGQGKNEESRAWLLARARDRSEDVDIRKNALFWAGQSGALSVEDLKGLYESLGDTEMKEQVIFVASQRKEAGAVDFLMDVAKNETDKDLRQRAIFWLGQSKDPRVADFLLTLISG
jgi:HEAT repeat protein